MAKGRGLSSCAGVAFVNGVHGTSASLSAADPGSDLDEEDAAPTANTSETPLCSFSESVSLEAVLTRVFFTSPIMTDSFLSRLLMSCGVSALRLELMAGGNDADAHGAWVLDGKSEPVTALCSTRLRLRRGLPRGTSRESALLDATVERDGSGVLVCVAKDKAVSSGLSVGGIEAAISSGVPVEGIVAAVTSRDDSGAAPVFKVVAEAVRPFSQAKSPIDSVLSCLCVKAGASQVPRLDEQRT